MPYDIVHKLTRDPERFQRWVEFYGSELEVMKAALRITYEFFGNLDGERVHDETMKDVVNALDYRMKIGRSSTTSPEDD